MKRNNFFGLLFVLVSSAALASDNTAPSPKKKLTLKDLLLASTTSHSHSTTVAGVRGLEETNAGVDTKARDYASIDWLNKMTVPAGELQKFVQEGKLK